MGSKWPIARIEDVTEKVAMGPFGSSIKVASFVPHGVPVISGQHLKGTRIKDGDNNFVTEEHAEKLRNANVHRGDVIFTHAGSIGQVAYIPDTSRFDRYVISQRQFYMRCNQEHLLPEFATWFFTSPLGQHLLLANTSSTGVPSIARPVTYLRTIEIPIPPLAIQRAIAHILGTLDDKIELNRRMNGTLESMAAAMFKSWFVDFDPVIDNALAAGNPIPDALADRAAVRAALGDARQPLPEDLAARFPSAFQDSPIGPIPEGWSIESLDSIAEFLNGLACQKYPSIEGEASLPVIKIRELRQGITANTDRAAADVPEKYLVVDGDVLFSWSGSLLVDVWSQGSGVLNQHVFKVTSERFPRWFFYYWTKHHLREFQQIAADKATTMGHIKRHHLADAKVLIPAPELLEAMTSYMAPLIEHELENDLAARSLTRVRDTLLPKLLSGELDVSSLDVGGVE